MGTAGSAGPGVSVGVVGGGPPTRVDPVGTVWPAGAGWHLEWWVGADDRWRIPANEVAVRQQRIENVAVVETAMRVPSGDAVQRVYATGDPGHPVVIDIENRSPAPFVAALVLRGPGRVEADGPDVFVDRAFVLSTSRAASRWAKTVGSPVQLPVTTGRAERGSFPGARDRSARLEVAFLHPVAHRTTLRAVVSRGRDRPGFDLRALGDAAAVAKGWRRVLDRGMQVQLPDRSLEARLRAARVEVLLQGQARVPAPEVVAALEDWGFVEEAAAAWRLLGARDRRRAAQRPPVGRWADLESIGDDAELLLATRRLLADDAPGGTAVALCTDWPEEWRGQPVELREAPVGAGAVSYAVRWHGPRPALLWDAPDGTELRIPGLDPTWTGTAPRGEALLASDAPRAPRG